MEVQALGLEEKEKNGIDYFDLTSQSFSTQKVELQFNIHRLPPIINNF
jgi:hypothetical protein